MYKPGCDEHLMVNQLRQAEEFIPELDFVAECRGKIVKQLDNFELVEEIEKPDLGEIKT